MINVMSYVGMSLQAEVCMWTLLGLLRTIFDATLFKVNANLKQVWKMKMPLQLSLPVQRVLRTMVSGVMLVQCFTLYVYLAVYIVLLYPVFLEERPTLVLPWLLLAAIRKLLCELTSLALGLGTCVLLGPAKPPCVRFLITKVFTIAIGSYMWILVLNYYHALKMAAAFKTFPAVAAPVDQDLGLELAVRRRRTKSLFDEEQLRRKIIAGLYSQRPLIARSTTRLKFDGIPYRIPSNNSVVDESDGVNVLRQSSITSNRTISDIVTFEDCLGTEVTVPRDTDRILEQFVTMSLRIATYLKGDGTTSTKYLDTFPALIQNNEISLNCNALSGEHTEPPPLVGSSKGKVASYLTNYPQIFMKKTSDVIQHTKTDLSQVFDKETGNASTGNIDYYNDRSAIYPETSNVIELRNNKKDYASKNSTSVNESFLKEYINVSSCAITLKIKSDISITMKPEQDPEESFEYVLNKVENQKNQADNSSSRDEQNSTSVSKDNHCQCNK